MKSSDDLSGLENIHDNDRVFIVDLIESENRGRTEIIPRKPPITTVKLPLTASSPSRRTKLKVSKESSLNVLYTNADQLTSTKMIELRQRIQHEKPSIVAICEVKSKNSKDRRDYDIPGYTIHSVDLDSISGRGIVVFTHSSLDKSVIQVKPSFDYEEACLVELKLRGSDIMLFACVYRSPTPSVSSDVNNENLNSFIKILSEKKYSHLCIVGDFNYRDINWRTWTTNHGQESKEAKFVETIRDCYLYQHNLKNSRRRGNDEPSLIDLILTDESMQISDVVHQAPIGKSDHDVLSFTFNCYLNYSKPKDKYVYHKGNFDEMRKHLEDSRWTENFVANSESKPVESLWESLKSKLLELRDKFVPKKKCGTDPSWKAVGGFPIDKDVRADILKKHTLHRKWMSERQGANSEEARLRYKRASNKVKNILRRCKRNYESSIANNSKSNPKRFWSHVRSKLKTKEGIAPLLENPKDKNSMKFTNDEKANILQAQFSSVFTKEPNSNVPSILPRSENNI